MADIVIILPYQSICGSLPPPLRRSVTQKIAFMEYYTISRLRLQAENPWTHKFFYVVFLCRFQASFSIVSISLRCGLQPGRFLVFSDEAMSTAGSPLRLSVISYRMLSASNLLRKPYDLKHGHARFQPRLNVWLPPPAKSVTKPLYARPPDQGHVYSP